MKSLFRKTISASKNQANNNDHSDSFGNKNIAPPCYLDGSFYTLLDKEQVKSSSSFSLFQSSKSRDSGKNQNQNEKDNYQMSLRQGSTNSLDNNNNNNNNNDSDGHTVNNSSIKTSARNQKNFMHHFFGLLYF